MFLGHRKDSLWSMEPFRCESASLRTHWVLVVMDQYSRRIIGFSVHVGKADGVAPLSHVQPRHPMATQDAQIPQYRQ
jgi:transposase InsO family protein